MEHSNYNGTPTANYTIEQPFQGIQKPNGLSLKRIVTYGTIAALLFTGARPKEQQQQQLYQPTPVYETAKLPASTPSRVVSGQSLKGLALYSMRTR